MADTKISGLTAATQVNGTDQFPVNQGGVSKRVTVSQLRQSAGTVPTINSVGTPFSSTAAPTATLPAVVAQDDILILVLQSSQQNLATPASYTQLGPQNGIGAAAAAGSTRLGIFWKRAGASESAPTITDSGDHTYGVMFTVRGCPTTGDPFRMIGQAWKFTASTTGTAAAGRTTVPNSLVVSIFAQAIDAASAQGSSPTNASLSSVTEVFDNGTADGTGGGIYVMSGVAAQPGPVAASTVTWGSSTVDVSTTLAFIPADAFSIARTPEVWTFIGGPPNLDDTWTKPSGATRVLAQLVDGGGGGSGGNTTTTAAGGGGGGGGGYDEAWFNASDLGATVVTHPGTGGAAGTALNQAGNAGTVSWFDNSNIGPLTTGNRIAGTAATAAASADGGNGGCGSGRGLVSPAVATTRVDLTAATAGAALGAVGGRGGSGTTAPVGGSPAEWGGGGGESGADTDAGIATASNGWSLRGASGGSGGRTNTNISQTGRSGGAFGVTSAQGAAGNDSTRLPYGGSGGVGGGSTVATGGSGGFPGGGGGGGGGVAGGFGGAGGHGIVMVTTFF